PTLDRLLLAELGELPDTDAGLRVWARVHGPIAERFIIAAAIPLRLAGGLRFIADRHLAAPLCADSLLAGELGGLMPDTPSWWQQQPPDAAAPPGEPKLIPEGRVDLDLTVSGRPERPRASAVVLARRLVVDRLELGSLLARASLDDGGLGIELTAEPGFAQLELRARLPARVDLQAGELDWSAASDDHLISLDVRALDLAGLRATLGAKLPALDRALAQAQLAGTISLALRGSGSLRQPRLLAAVRAGDLRHRQQALGQLRLFAAYVPGEAELELQLDGPLARRLDARVRAPLSLPSDGRPLRFDPTRDWLAQLRIDELSLASLAAHVGELPIRGQLSAGLELSGSLADPRVDLRARRRAGGPGEVGGRPAAGPGRARGRSRAARRRRAPGRSADPGDRRGAPADRRADPRTRRLDRALGSGRSPSSVRDRSRPRRRAARGADRDRARQLERRGCDRRRSRGRADLRHLRRGHPRRLSGRRHDRGSAGVRRSSAAARGHARARRGPPARRSGDRARAGPRSGRHRRAGGRRTCAGRRRAAARRDPAARQHRRAALRPARADQPAAEQRGQSW